MKILSLILLFLVVCATNLNYNSEVVVFVYLGQDPVNQATVQLIQGGNIIYQGSTGISGKAVFHNVVDGTYTIKAIAGGIGSGVLYNQQIQGGYCVFTIYLTDIEKINH